MDGTGELDPEARLGPPHLGDEEIRQLSEILAYLKPSTFMPGEHVFSERDPGDRVYVIESGIVKITRRLAGEHDHLVAIAGPGDIVGELSVLDPGPRSSSVVALTSVAAGWLDRAVLHSWITEHPGVSQILLQLLARQVKRRYRQLTDMAAADAESRVARQLSDLATRFGLFTADGVNLQAIVTVSELGELAGAAPPALNQILDDFADVGWIRRLDHGVLVVDQDALELRAILPAENH